MISKRIINFWKIKMNILKNTLSIVEIEVAERVERAVAVACMC